MSSTTYLVHQEVSHVVDVVDDLLEPELVGLMSYDEQVLIRYRLLSNEVGSQDLASQQLVKLQI